MVPETDRQPVWLCQNQWWAQTTSFPSSVLLPHPTPAAVFELSWTAASCIVHCCNWKQRLLEDRLPRNHPLTASRCFGLSLIQSVTMTRHQFSTPTISVAEREMHAISIRMVICFEMLYGPTQWLYVHAKKYKTNMLNMNWILGSVFFRNPNGKGLVEWPQYGLNEEYLELNLEQRKAEKLRKNKVDFWLKTLPEKMKKMAEGKEKHGEL